MRFLYNYDRKYDIRYISLYYKLCSWLGIVPLFNFNDLNKDVRDIGYVLFTGILISVTFVIAVYIRILYVYTGYKNIKVMLDFSNYASAMLCSITILLKTITNSKEFCEMLRNIAIIDKHLHRETEKLIINWLFYLETSVPYLLFIIHSIALFTSMGNYLPDFNTPSLIYRDVQQMHVLTMCILLHHFSIIYFYRYKTFNELLLTKVSSYYVAKQKMFVIEFHEKFNEYLTPITKTDNIKEFLKNYSRLSQCFKSLNNFFGLPVLMISFNIILGLLRPLMTVIESDMSKMPAIFIILNISLALKGVALALLVVPSYHIMAQESRKTANVCFTLLKKYRNIPDDKQDKALREDLLTLGLYAASKYPKLTADGYYVIDYTTLLMIFGSVASYFIVLIQLN